MVLTQDRDSKMRTIFETAQKMKNGKIPTVKSFDGIEAFIDSIKKE